MNSGELIEQLRSGIGTAQAQSIEILEAQVSSGSTLEDALISTLDELLRDEKVAAQLKVRIVGLFGEIQDETMLERVRWARHHVKDFYVRKRAYEVLEHHFQGDAVDREILVLQHHVEPQNRIQAIRTLSTHHDDKRVIPALKIALLTDHDVVIRQASAEILIKIQGENCVSVLTNAIIGGKLSHYWVTSQLRLKRVPFDGAKMMERIRQNAPQEVLDEIEQVNRNMSNR